LREDEAWLEQMTKVIGERQVRVDANRQWLYVHGFPEASLRELTVTNGVSPF